MTPSAGSFDTNLLLRFLLFDIEEQAEAVIQRLEYGTGNFTVADAAIVELVFVLGRYYKFPRSRIVESVMTIMAIERVDCNRALLLRVLPVFVTSPSLSFEDCCLVTYAELDDALPLWTFDKKLASKAPSARLVPMAKSNKR